VRVSGPKARFGIETLAGPLPAPRLAELRSIRNLEGDVIDTGLLLFFPAPNSFTGEDCAEFQIHGGRAVLSALLVSLGALEGFRPAEAGEFTKRAFENGKLDLTAVEGLSDLVAAETEMQRRLALDQADGKLAALYDHWAGKLTRCRALVEASVDFADEGDVPADLAAEIRTELCQLRDALNTHLSGSRTAEIIRDGFRVAIAGAPNAGKSSLLNTLARRDVAIVSPEPGTTRDIVTVTLDLGGYAVIVQDTAGLRDADGVVEREGIRRATAAMAAADLVLLLHDLTGASFAEIPAEAADVVRIGSKRDLVGGHKANDVEVCISSTTGDGIPELLALLRERVATAAFRSGDGLAARERQRAGLRDALAHLDAALDERLDAPELLAEELRAASHALGRITGRVDVEDLLDVIFSSFCIGK
jgi:tRNA modification GTPase